MRKLFAAALAFTALATSGAAYAGESGTVVARIVYAYQQFDEEAFLSEFADDVEVYSFDGAALAIGKAELRALYALNFQQQAPVARIVESYENGDRVIQTEAYQTPQGELCCAEAEYVVEGGKVQVMFLGVSEDLAGG